MKQNTDLIETSALKIGVVINVIMAIAGWVAYSVTGSEALFLDGNFSFISSITTVGAIIIIHKKHKRTAVFPYGRYFYESFFTLSKGILILGVIIAAVFQNVIKIIRYFEGESLERLKTGPIVIYMILMVFLCFGLAYLFHSKNKKINFKSSILAVETKASKIDGFMTIAVGIALVLTTFVPDNSKLSFLLYIGDAIIVILMALLLLKTPFDVIKEGFIELGGGSLQSQEDVSQIEKLILQLIPGSLHRQNCHVSKTGSSHLVLIYASSKEQTLDLKVLTNFRRSIHKKIEENFPNAEVEIVFHD
jgi:divalent metal cation (Fe/Co/Zn/Cd) transporter